jgi:hypothetical protein
MGGLGGRLVGGVIADNRENGIGCALSDHIGLRARLSLTPTG